MKDSALQTEVTQATLGAQPYPASSGSWSPAPGSEFVRDAAVHAAERVLLEGSLVRMTPEGFAASLTAARTSRSKPP